MYLWIFKTSTHWDYCSGGAVVTAKDFEEAVKLLKEYENKNEEKDVSCEYTIDDTIYQVKEATLKYLNRESQDITSIDSLVGIYVFYLVEKFEVSCDTSRVIMHEFNYA